jgi:hypothetical protein
MLRDVLEGRITVPGRAARERTVPGIASRDTVDILTSPGDLAPASEANDAISPTVYMPREVVPEPMPQPAQQIAPAAAASPLMPRRSSMAVLAALLVANVLAWWWFLRDSAPGKPPLTTAVVTAPAAAPAKPASAAIITAAPAETGSNETILSVLPARVPRVPSVAAAAASARALEAPLPRSAAIEPIAPRVADATAGRAIKPAAAEIADPIARCGERNFFSKLLCLKRECQNAAASAHPECVKLREQEATQSSSSDR